MQNTDRNVPVTKVRELVRDLVSGGSHLAQRDGKYYFGKNLALRGINSNREFSTEDAAIDSIVETYFGDELRKTAAA